MLPALSQQNRAYVFAGSTVLLWSTVASAFKLSLRYLDVLQLLLISSLSASFFLLIILLWQNKGALVFRLKRRDYLRLLLFGLLNPFLYYLVLFRAYDLLPAQIAQALNYTWAITLMFLSIPMLGHRISRYDILATLVCYSGVVLICMGGMEFSGGAFDAGGIVLALGSTLIWALYWLHKTRDELDAVVSLFLSFLFSLPFVGLAWYCFSDSSDWHPYGLSGGIYIGLIEMGAGFLLWLRAMRLTHSVASISTLIYCSPFLSLCFIHYFVGEAIVASTVFGLGLIIIGLLLQGKGRR